MKKWNTQSCRKFNSAFNQLCFKSRIRLVKVLLPQNQSNLLRKKFQLAEASKFGCTKKYSSDVIRVISCWKIWNVFYLAWKFMEICSRTCYFLFQNGLDSCKRQQRETRIQSFQIFTVEVASWFLTITF